MTRPSRHLRRVHTKHGRKLRLINPYVQKRTYGFLPIYARPNRPKSTIPRMHRRVLNTMADPKKFPIEFGGGLDFGRNGQLERIEVQAGTGYHVDLPDDFEVMYHTHPGTKSPPSPTDIDAFLHTPRQQAELVISPDKTYVVTKTPFIRALSGLPATQFSSKLGRAYFHARRRDPKHFEQRWKDILGTHGFVLTSNPTKDRALTIRHIRPVEPPRRTGGPPWAS